jgi:hypothetical protein
MVTRIGIVFGPMDAITKNIISYLLTYENSLQVTFEFRILLCPNKDTFVNTLIAKRPHPTVENVAEVNDFFSRVISLNEANAASYDIDFEEVDAIVLLTNTAFSDGYYYSGIGHWSIIALGEWHNTFAPPSIVEYYLSILVIVAIDAVIPDMHRHFDTRGCMFDFNASLSDVRLSVLSGHLCSVCATQIEIKASKQVLDDSRILLKRDWLGKTSDPSDISVTVKKLGYDLFHTAGARPTFRERCLAILEQEGLKNLLGITFQILLTIALVIIGLKR